MKFLKTKFNDFKIHLICKKFNIKNYSINPDGSIDVSGDVELADKNLTKLPLKFGHVGGDFDCSYNQLTSLEGCPQSIGGNFYCYINQIKDFGSKYFKFNKFYCFNNPIKEIYDLNPCQEFIEYLIEYQVIRDGNKIIKQRLIQSLEDSNWKEKEFELENYKLV